MITHLTASRLIDAPVRRVYDQWTQFEEFPRFMSAVKSIHQVDDTRTRWDVSIGGVERSFDAVITEQVPDQQISWASVEEPVHTGEVRFEPEEGGTRVTLLMSWAPESIVEKAGAVLNLDEIAAERDLDRFADFIAERGTATGAWRGEVGDGQPEADVSPDSADGIDPDIRL